MSYLLVIILMEKIIQLIVSTNQSIELSIKTLKEGRDYGSDPSLRQLYVKSSLALYTLELVLKVG